MPDLDAVYRSCIDSICKASPDIKPGEAKALLKRLGTIKKIVALDPNSNLKDSLQNILKDQVEQIRVGKLQKQFQIAKQKETFQNKLAVVQKSDKAADQLKAFTGKLLGTYSEKQGGRDATDVIVNTSANQAASDLKGALDAHGLWKYFTKGIDEQKVAKELSELNKKEGKPGTTGSKDALRAAKAIKVTVDKYLDIGERQGIFVDRLEGYSAQQTHNPDLIRHAGLDQWAKDILPRLDKLKTFGDLDPSKWGEYLKNKYLNITSGLHLDYQGGVDKSFKPTGSNIAAKAAAQRTIHFNTTEDAYKYNQTYGSRSFREQIISSLVALARRSALAQEWGVNPELNMENVLNEIKNTAREQEDKATLDATNGKQSMRTFLGTPRAVMDEVLGKTRVAAQKNFWYQFNQWVHTLRSMASLGTAAISAQSDLINLAGHLATISGSSPLTEMAKVSSKYYLPHESNVEKISNACGLTIHALRAQLINDRFGSFDPSGASGKLAAFFFKANLLHFHDERITNVGAALVSQLLGNYLGSSFEELPKSVSTWLTRYNITPEEWQGLRTNSQNKGYLTPIDAEHISDLEPTQQDALRLKVGAMFTDMAGSTVPRASARERVMMYRGFPPDTWEGAMLRMLTMYKTFPVSMVSKILNRNLYGQAKGTLSTAASAGLLFGMAIAMGAGIYALKQLISGKTTPEANTVKGAKTLLLRGLTAGGGTGFFGDVLSPEDDKEKFSDSFKDLVGGPIGGDALNLGGAAVDTLKGNQKPQAGEKQMVNLASNYVPFSNYFATKFLFNYYVKYAILNSIDPDYTKKMEKNMKKNDGTRFIVPPASNARR